MKPITWGSGLRFGDKNLRWGNPSYMLEPGDPGYVAPPPPPLPLKAKHHKHAMHQDPIPQSYKNLRDWLTLQQTELTAALATTIGMTAAERTTYLATVTTLLTPVTSIVALMDQLEQETADFHPLRETLLPSIRAAMKRAKTSPTCTPAIQLELDWVGDVQNTDPNTARPTLTAEAQRGRVKIDGRKPGFEAVNIYSRKKGDVQWKLIAVRKRKFPYFDEAPLTTPNQPEVREYMAIGVVNDEEVGQPSEIIEVVYAG